LPTERRQQPTCARADEKQNDKKRFPQRAESVIKPGGKEMASDSLAQVKMGTEALALCIAGVLCERDPSLLTVFRENVEMLYRVLDDRGDHEAAAMVSAFGRALADPAFKTPAN
jgi:hypothetical protein